MYVVQCEYAGTGRQARLRGVCFYSVWVQVPLLAPKQYFINDKINTYVILNIVVEMD